LVQKLLGGDTQTGDLISLTFLFKERRLKRRGYNLPTSLFFIDYEKTFDRVDRSKLWAILHNKGYTQHLINIIKVLYNNSNFCLRTEGKNTDKKEITNQGLKQGCSLSPIHFNTYRHHKRKLDKRNK
jgi:hypothetical protein